MQRTITSSIVVAAFMAVAVGQVWAADELTAAPLTREQVKAETAEAIRTGDIVDPETQLKLNQLFPGAYAGSRANAKAEQPTAQPVAKQPGKTRDEVRAETAEAIRIGDIVDPETQLKLNQLFPSQYPAKALAQIKPSEQVQQALTQTAGLRN